MVQRENWLTLPDLPVKRHEILHVADARGARNVRVFGSVARNEAQETSDIDSIVNMEQNSSVLDPSELILDLEKILRRKVNVITVGRPSQIAGQTAREAVSL
jgi:uncharacterized protein